jgi:hypothetical protein
MSAEKPVADEPEQSGFFPEEVRAEQNRLKKLLAWIGVATSFVPLTAWASIALVGRVEPTPAWAVLILPSTVLLTGLGIVCAILAWFRGKRRLANASYEYRLRRELQFLAFLHNAAGSPDAKLQIAHDLIKGGRVDQRVDHVEGREHTTYTPEHPDDAAAGQTDVLEEANEPDEPDEGANPAVSQ